MFQIGDKVVCVESKEGVVTFNKEYIIRQVRGTTYVRVNTDGGGLSGDLMLKRFVLARTLREPPKNDYEWLDRVQQNFKE